MRQLDAAWQGEICSLSHQAGTKHLREASLRKQKEREAKIPNYLPPYARQKESFEAGKGLLIPCLR